ncbi:MAG TPA: hypothetical protein DIW46_02060 [Microbacterium sp.]|nr:hypothetical protein [Microbacterium sp.]
MAVSTQAVKVGQAKVMADYYEKKADDMVVEIQMEAGNEHKSIEEVRMIARVRIERHAASQEGRDPDEAEKVLRASWSEQSVGQQSAYYASDGDGRSTWIRGDKAGQPVREGELEELFLGQSEGRRLDDPHVKQLTYSARLTGYKGELTPEAVDALRNGCDPQTGEVLTGDGAEQIASFWDAPDRKAGDVGAFDLTFSAPKGVSLLAAFGDEETRESIFAAQNAAVERALEFAQDNGVITTRRGKGGAERIQAELGEVATKAEITSRAGDPQLHTHTLVSNFVKGADGRHTTLDSQVWHGATAGIDAAYLRALSDELGQRIGVRLEHRLVGDKVRLAGVPGISQELEEQFSTRRQQINEELNERLKEQERLESTMGLKQDTFRASHDAQQRGAQLTPDQERQAAIYAAWLNTGVNPQSAALGTRSSKAEESEAQALERWSQATGMPDGKQLLEEAKEQSSSEELEFDKDGLFARMEWELVEKQAMFSASEVYACALRWAPQGHSNEEVMAAAGEFLTARAVRLEGAPDMAKVGDIWSQKASGWTTQAVVAQRQHITQMARGMASKTIDHHQDADGTRVKLMHIAGDVARKQTLTSEQEEFLAAVLTGQQLVTTQGLAGTGKSHAMKAAIRVLQESGADVSVAATKAELAANLAVETGANRGFTLHSASQERTGLFKTGMWQQGLNDEQIREGHRLDDQVVEARLRGDEKAVEIAKAALQEWQKSLPTKREAESTSTKRGNVELADKAAKFLGANGAREILDHQRQKLIEEKGQQPEARARMDGEKRKVIIVDEAGMTSDDHIEELLKFAEKNNIQVVLVGDYAQLSAVDRSGAFREVLDHVAPVELRDIRRAENEWERDVQTRMHDLAWDNSFDTIAEASELVEVYETHGQLLSAGSSEEIQEAIARGELDPKRRDLEQQLAAKKAADWFMDHHDSDAAVLVPTKQMQVQISADVQKRRQELPEDHPFHLDPHARKAVLRFDGLEQEVQKGETIAMREGMNRLGLKNGWRGEVVRVSNTGGITAQFTDERGRTFQRSIPQAELDKGRVSLSYSSTVHRAQGMTLDDALYVHDPSKEQFVDRQLIYPALSRGTRINQTLLVGEREEAKASFTRRMATSRSDSIRVATERTWQSKEAALAEVRADFPEMSNDAQSACAEGWAEIQREEDAEKIAENQRKQRQSLSVRSRELRAARAEAEKNKSRTQSLQHERVRMR